MGPLYGFQRTQRQALALLAACLLLQSCGGGGGGGNDSGTAPTISNFSIGPTAVYVGAGSGSQLVHGEFDFTDPDGDVATGTLEARDAAGNLVDSQTFQIGGTSGVTSGTISADAAVDTSTAGIFSVRVTLTDRRGLKSNGLTTTFRISEFPWVTRAPMLLPRRDFATAAVDGKIYVLGGGDTQAPIIPSPATATVQVYDPATDAWSAAAPMPVAVRDEAAAVVDGKIYVVGGAADIAPGLKTLQVYDPVMNTWTTKADMPVELAGNAAASGAGQLYVFGGSSGGLDTANVLAYDVASDTWSTLGPMLQAGRDVAAVTVAGKPLVLGGYSINWVPDGGYLRAVQQYDSATTVWTSRADMDIARSDFGVALVDSTIYVAGGGNWTPALADLSAYDVAADTWSAKTPMPQALAWPRAETVNGRVYVFDGQTTLEYTPANDIL